MNTTVPPVSVAGCMMQLHAVTWKRGVGAISTECAGGAAGAAAASGAVNSPAAMALASAIDIAVVM